MKKERFEKMDVLKNNNEATSIYYISCLRILATVSVVWLHTCSTLVENNEIFHLNTLQYSFFQWGYQIMYWAVPIFLMITGALMLPRENTYDQCLKKYIRRILLALIVFGLPFAVIKVSMEKRIDGIGLILISLRAIVEDNGFSHMWYLYMLIGIYLTLPILQFSVAKMKDEHFRWIFGSLILFDFIVPTIKSVTGLHIAVTMPFTYSLFYLFAGYYIHTRTIRLNKKKMVCIGGG